MSEQTDLFVGTGNIGIVLAKLGLCTGWLAIPLKSRHTTLSHDSFDDRSSALSQVKGDEELLLYELINRMGDGVVSASTLLFGSSILHEESREWGHCDFLRE